MAPSEAAVTARLVTSLQAGRPAYPFASLQAGQYFATGLADPGGRPLRPKEAIAVAERLGSPVTPILADFPDLLLAAVETALREAEIEATRVPLVDRGGTGDLASALLAWQARLPAALFATLCELNQADLLLLDTVAELHAGHMG